MTRSKRLILPFAALLCLAACNQQGSYAQHDFNAAGHDLGNGDIGSGADETGHGFSHGANATGEAISHTAHNIANSPSS